MTICISFYNTNYIYIIMQKFSYNFYVVFKF